MLMPYPIQSRLIQPAGSRSVKLTDGLGSRSYTVESTVSFFQMAKRKDCFSACPNERCTLSIFEGFFPVGCKSMRVNQTAWKNASSTSLRFSITHLYPLGILIHLK